MQADVQSFTDKLTWMEDHVLEIYLDTVVQKIERALGPYYRRLGLTLDYGYNDVYDAYTIYFRGGEHILFPVYLMAELPEEADNIPAKLEDM